MESIDRIIEDYLLKEKVDYAMMIRGKFGTGKTHYYKNRLEKRIRTFIVPTSKKGIKYIPIYISLFGVDGKSDLITKMFQALLPASPPRMKVIGQTFGVFAQLFIKGDFKSLELALCKNGVDFVNMDKYVFVFDDLEKISMDVTSALGEINSFVEHKGVKTILIADETKMLEETDDFKGYTEYKNKIIRRSIEYVPEMNEILDGIVKEVIINKLLSGYINTHKQMVIDVFKRKSLTDIRTIKFAFENIDRVLNCMRTKTIPDSVLTKIVLFTLSMSLEYKDDAANLKKFDGIKTIYDFFVFKMGEKEKDGKESYFKTFYEIYYENVEANFYCYPSIVKYVSSGIINDTEIEKEINDSYPIKDNPDENAIPMLYGAIYNLTDGEFVNAINNMLRLVRNGSVEFRIYPGLFSRLLLLAEWKLIKLDKVLRMIPAFKKGIDKSARTAQYAEEFVFDSGVESEYVEKYSKEIQEYYESKKNELKQREVRKYAVMISALTIENAGEIAGILSGQGYQKNVLLLEPILLIVDINKLCSSILKLPNRQLCGIAKALNRRIEIIGKLKKHIKEKESIDLLVDAVRRNARQKKVQKQLVRMYILRNIMSLRDKIKRIEAVANNGKQTEGAEYPESAIPQMPFDDES